MSLTNRRERLPTNRTNLSSRPSTSIQSHRSLNSSTSDQSAGFSKTIQSSRVITPLSNTINSLPSSSSGSKTPSIPPSRQLSNNHNDSNLNRTSLNESRPQTVPYDISNTTLSSFTSSQRNKPLFESTFNSTMSQHKGSYARPKVSQVYPLRSVLLDIEANTFSPSKTRSELVRKIKRNMIPHPSFDLNNDGYVSQEDYRDAKRFDLDADGMINDHEKEFARKKLAEEFFKGKYHDELQIIDPNFTINSQRTNVNNLLASKRFEEDFDRLKRKVRGVQVKSSVNVDNCLRLPDNTLTKYNFYANKFDATAWNDYDAIPRSESKFGLSDHGGSRQRLLFARREINRQICAERMEEADSKRETVINRRINLITNPAIENC